MSKKEKFNYSLAIKKCLDQLKLNIANNEMGEKIVLEAIDIMEEIRISIEELAIEAPSLELSVYKKEFLHIYEEVVKIKTRKLTLENRHYLVYAIDRIIPELLDPYIKNEIQIFESQNSIINNLNKEEK